MLPIWLLAAMMIMMYYWRFWDPWASALLVVLLPKLWKFWLAQLFWDVFLGLTLTGHKKLQNQQLYIIDWMRKRLLLVDAATLATCCHDDYDVLLGVLGTLGKCYVSNPVAKTLVWIENHDWHNCFWMSSWGSPLLDPKKLQNQQFYKIDWIRKNSGSMLPIWLLAAMMIMMCCWRFWEPWASALLVVLLPKLWKFWLAQLFWDVFLGLTLTGPKKASKPTILHNRLNEGKKLLVDVANLATCCHGDYDVLLEVLGTLGKCYVSNPVAKTLVWLKIMTGTTVFGCLPGAHPYWTQKSFKTNNFT